MNGVHPLEYTLIAAFDCTIGCVYYELSQAAGTSTDTYFSFIQQMCNNFLPTLGDAGFVQRTIIHDNLRSHLNVRVTAAIHLAGHHVVPRPPYRPCDAPVKFAFNELQRELDVRSFNTSSGHDLGQQIGAILQGMHGMDATFVHCGYQ